MVDHESDVVPRSAPQDSERESLKRQAVIYVIEDDDAGREALCAWLDAQGFQPSAHPTADQFLDSADLGAQGCIITDFRMPGLSGTDLQVELAERESALPVIVVSGYADVPVTVRAMRQGAVTLLEKPYDNAQLLVAIDEALLRNDRARKEQDRLRRVRARLAELTSAQRKIMHRLIAGQPNKSIADTLDLGLRTVERHRQQILKTMQVESLPELAALLADTGVTDSPEC